MLSIRMGGIVNVLDVKSLISFDHRIMTYKLLHGLFLENLCYKFVERFTISEYTMRNHRDIQIPKDGLEYAKRTLYYSGVKKLE